jgi:23S rRNA (cytidine2498-2'-O)-methyltransferase
MTRQTRHSSRQRPPIPRSPVPQAPEPLHKLGPWLYEPFTVYLAADGCAADLARELGPDNFAVSELLLVASGPPRPAAWAANVWLDPRPLKIVSIGDAVKQLKAIQRNWSLLPLAHHRRAALIEEQLPKVSAKPLVFGSPAPTAPLGSWTLLTPELLLASPRCSSPFRNGQAVFVEDKEGPPNRAYLKLWEAFTLFGVWPKPGETCLDLGASPGGWTWVLQKLGANVIAVDKAPLEPAIAALPGVTVRQQSAFALEPSGVGRIDWLLSDVICYPERLLRLVKRWLDAGFTGRCLCTIKFQADTDFAAIAAFSAIPGSRLMHLSANKHELTWVRL